MSEKHHPDHVEPNETPLDSWHQHLPAEGLPREEHGAHANVPLLLAIFVVLFAATVIFSLGIGIYTMREFSKARGEGERIGLTAVIEDVREYKRESAAAQSGYGWTEEGNVRLPIDRAMDLVVENRGN